MWNKGIPLGNKGITRLLLRENQRACPTYQVCIERESVPTVTHNFDVLVEHLSIPSFSNDVSCFLYEVNYPGLQIPVTDIPLEYCPRYTGDIYVYPSANAIFHAPGDLSGVGGMLCEHIRSTSSWRKGPERQDCVYIVHDQDLVGFQGLFVAQVQLFFKIKYNSIVYPCAWVLWFMPAGSEPCPDTGMWRVEPEFDESGERATSVVPLDAILRAAHLVGITGEEFLPIDLKHTDSLTAFNSFYVNKFIDYHAHEIVF